MLLGVTDQERLRAADRRQIEEQAEMTGDAAAARMGDPLAVNEQQVRAMLQRPDRLQPDRRLAEGEEAGDVRKGDRSLDDAVPGQFSGTCTTINGGGDFSITYPDSATCVGSSRTGCQVEITLTYRQPLFVPLVGEFLSADAQNRVQLTATVTMVIN